MATEEKALTVAPWRPVTPTVVTTVTLLATDRMAPMKAARGVLLELVHAGFLLAAAANGERLGGWQRA